MYSTGKYSHQFVITSNGDGEGQRSLVCCSPWHRKELDTIELLNNNFKWSIIRKNIESLCCMLETNTVLLINHTLIEKKRESREMLSPRLQTPPTCPELSWMHCLSERGGTGASLPAPPTLTTSAVSALSPCFGIAPGMPASCNPRAWEGSGFGMMSQKGAQPWRGSVNML